MRIITLTGVLAGIVACGEAASEPVPEVRGAAAGSCTLETPLGAPARFLGCGEELLAIVTPGSHCVPGEQAQVARFECDDGSVIEIAAEDGRHTCTVREGATADDYLARCARRGVSL